MPQKAIPTIPDSQVAAKAAVSEDLMTRLRNSARLAQAFLDSFTGNILEGAVDSVVTTTIVDADPTSGEIFQDDQFDGFYLHFTSGAVFSANSRNRFKITITNKAANSISTAEDLAAAGVVATDTYVIIGHTHDGASVEPDGSGIDFKDLINVAEDLAMTQDLVDAIMDPDSIRTASVSKANPLISLADGQLVTAYTEAGKSQTRTGNSGPTGNTHTIILPKPAVDYLLFATFKINSTAVGGTSEIIFGPGNNVINQVSKNDSNSGTIIIIVQDGNTLTAHNGFNGVSGTMSATFDILATVEL